MNDGDDQEEVVFYTRTTTIYEGGVDIDIQHTKTHSYTPPMFKGDRVL